MALGKQFRAESCRVLAGASVGASYTPIGVPITKPDSILHFQNLTDATVWISYDGVIDHFPLVTNGYVIIDITTNQPTPGGLFISNGTQLYAKQLNIPTTGSLYVTAYYGRD